MSHDDALGYFDKFLRSFVPPDAFDAHMHLYRGEDATASLPKELLDEQGNASWAAYCKNVERWMGDRRPSGGLIFTIPKVGMDMAGANRFVADEVRRQPGSRALMMIHPKDDPAQVEATLKADGFVGFKVYHVFSGMPDTFEAPTSAFIPEWAWELANTHGLAIMLHMVKARAMADTTNQSYIREHCLQYPNAKLILAHAARGFSGGHTVEGIAALRGIDNVYCDNSAVCEAVPMEAVIREFGTGRLMFGTDFPVSDMRGRCVTIGDGFQWLYEDTLDWQKSKFAHPQFIGLESLRALQQACHTLRLRDDDVERIFSTNARQLLGITQPTTGQTQAAYEKARKLIPGGTQLLSKRPEMYAPDRWPAYYREARGCEVIDLDGRRYTDMTTSAIGACLLGYADPDVTDAVIRRVSLGSMCTLNCVEELELAELLTELHPWAERVRYCRTGGETMAAAVRIARAFTGRERIAFCGYHGWSDWYLAANIPASGEQAKSSEQLKAHLLPGLDPSGVPSGLGGTMLPFGYNKLEELELHFRQHGRQIAAVVMEPTRAINPEPGFLEGVRNLCREYGAVFIFDEISVGWRLAVGGAHLKFGVQPDIAVFAKALGNGHPMGAIIGRAPVMEASQSSFISSTYWTEGVGPTAALATVRKLRALNAPAHAEQIGTRFRNAWTELGKKHEVPVRLSGHPAVTSFGFDHADAAALGTLFTTRMLDRGYLIGSGFYPSMAHQERHIDGCMSAANEVFPEIADAIRLSDAAQRLSGPVRHTGFARLTG